MFNRLYHALNLAKSYSDYPLRFDELKAKRFISGFSTLPLTDQINTCDALDSMNSTRIEFPIYNLSAETILRICDALDFIRFRRPSKSVFPQYEIDLSMYALESKAILLLSHVYNLPHAELSNLTASDLIVCGGHPFLRGKPYPHVENPIVFNRYKQVLSKWCWLRSLDTNNDRLFQNIDPIKAHSEHLGFRLNAHVRFMFLMNPIFLVDNPLSLQRTY